MTTAPKISVVIYTARHDHPFENPEWHCFDPVVKTLSAQTFTDFELIIVDMIWETRQDYFIQHPAPFPVKHVPSKPNYWQDRGRVGLCGQINRGYAWADGELIQMGGENNMFHPQFLENVWNVYKKTGKTPVAWYGICGTERRPERHPKCPVDFDLLGYTQNHVTDMDHRGFQFLDPKIQIADCHHQNYFGYSAVTTEAAMAVNGFDELFDGQWSLFDCDFGGRLEQHGVKMVNARGIYVMEPPVRPADYAGITRTTAFKCHYAMLLHNRATKRRVNQPLPSNYVESVKKIACFDQCAIKDKCKAKNGSVGESAYYPFCEGEHRQEALDWFANAPVRDLRADRRARIDGAAPFDRGTFHTP